MVLSFVAVLESIFGTLRTTRSGCSKRGGGRFGRDGFLIISPVTLDEGDVGGPTGTAVSDKSPCSTSELARPGSVRSVGGRGGRGSILILLPVTLEEGDARWLTRGTVSDELPCRGSRLARPEDIRSGCGRAGRHDFLVLSLVTLTLKEGDVGRPTRTVILGKGRETGGGGLESF